jgi:hypothetical protein
MKNTIKVALVLATLGLLTTFIGKALDGLEANQEQQKELRERGSYYRCYGTMKGYSDE